MDPSLPISPAASASTKALVRGYFALYPAEVARHFETADPGQAASVLDGEEATVVTAVLRRMGADQGARVLGQMKDGAVGLLLSQLDPAIAARLLSQLDQAEQKRILDLASPTVGGEIRTILAYPPGTAGAIMDTRVSGYALTSPVNEALDRVRMLRDRRVTDLVLHDDEGNFAGVVPLQDVVGAAPALTLGELRSGPSVHVEPMTTQEEVVELLNKHRLTSLPVVDFDGQTVGIIRHAGLVSAAQQDMAAGMQAMVGASAVERALSKPSVGIRGRLPWLNINLITAFLAASVVGLFEATIAQFTALAVMLPVVAGQSGNTGAQALAVTMRGLSLREMRVSHTARVLFKELVIGCVNGLAIAVVTSIGVFLWSRSTGLALVMFIAMVFSMVIASIAGAAIPIGLVKMGRDPATASSIILTTVTDIVGFFSFLGLATLMSGMLEAG